MKRTTAAVLLLLVLVGCSGRSQTDSETDSGSTASSGGAVARSEVATGDQAAAPANAAVMKRQVIATGSVAITGRHLARPTQRVNDIVTAHRGTVADEQSTANRKGEATHTRIVVRVPSTEFSDAMRDLADVPGVRRADRSSDDVTTQVIDVAQRVKAQRTGLDRVNALLSRAGSLTEVLALDKEITSRQAELDSLLQQQAYLADQTSLSTITVTLTRTAAAPIEHDGRPAGFWAGLGHGWHAFGLFVSGALTGIGAALPFALATLVIGVPAWLVVRRRRRLA